MNDGAYKLEGYWNNSWNTFPNFPLPKHSDEPFDNKGEILARLVELESVAEVIYWRGPSPCRCCANMFNGSREFRLNGWSWPEGFKHYIEEHNVRPSDRFLKELF